MDKDQLLNQTPEDLDKELNEIALKYKVAKALKLIVPLGEKGDELIVGYIKKPERTIFAAAVSLEARSPVLSKEFILNNCWLEGDKRIIEDDDTFYNACTVMDDVFTIRQAYLKKN